MHDLDGRSGRWCGRRRSRRRNVETERSATQTEGTWAKQGACSKIAVMLALTSSSIGLISAFAQTPQSHEKARTGIRSWRRIIIFTYITTR